MVGRLLEYDEVVMLHASNDVVTSTLHIIQPCLTGRMQALAACPESSSSLAKEEVLLGLGRLVVNVVGCSSSDRGEEVVAALLIQGKEDG